MSDYSEICLKTFLKDQKKLFDEPVAENLEEAEAFLEDCMAVVVHSLDEVREYFEEEGADIDGMTREELKEASPGRDVFDRRRITGINISKKRNIWRSRSLFDCGFSYGFLNCVQYDLGCIRRIFRQGDIVQGLCLIHLFRNVFYGRLDEREHSSHGFIQVGKSDGIDARAVHGDFNLQVCIIQGKGGCIDPWGILFPRIRAACIFVRAEHDDKQDNEQDSECRKDGSINDLLHVQDNDFCSGTHRVTSRSIRLPVLRRSVFYKCMTGKRKIFMGTA